MVFLDYDGTLTPIVERPESAVISEEMRETVRQLANCCRTAIVSGRSLENVRDFLKIESLIYSGSHGFDIAGPGIPLTQHKEGERFLPTIDAVYQKLAEGLEDVEGVFVEHVKFSLSVHYRLVADDKVSEVEKVVDRVLEEHPPLRKTHGKKVFELRPGIEWDKGKAVLWILETLGLKGSAVVPLYLGDDVTDEDGFRVLKGWGIGILVTETPRASEASYSLRNPDEVYQFLRRLISFLV